MFWDTGTSLGSLPLCLNCRRSNSFAIFLTPFLLFALGWHKPLAAWLGFR